MPSEWKGTNKKIRGIEQWARANVTKSGQILPPPLPSGQVIDECLGKYLPRQGERALAMEQPELSNFGSAT